MTGTIRVLMVCTGNICRSPTAEGVLRRKLADAGLQDQVEVASAGTVDYHAGSPPDHRAQQSARRRGYDLSRQRARQLRVEDFERFDLVLAMDADHVAEMNILIKTIQDSAAQESIIQSTRVNFYQFGLMFGDGGFATRVAG